MGITVYQYDDGIIWLEFVGKWTWLDYRYASEDAIAIMETLDHRVDVVADMRQAASAPADSSDNQTIRDSLERAPGNYGITVFIGPDRFTRMIFEILQNYIPKMKSRIFMADTIEDAEDIVYSNRAQFTVSHPR